MKPKECAMLFATPVERPRVPRVEGPPRALGSLRPVGGTIEVPKGDFSMMNMRTALAVGLLLTALAAPSYPAKKKPDSPYKGRVPQNSTIFIASMQGGLDGFIAAEILKQKVPVRVVTEETVADFIMSGISLKEDDHWYNVVFGGKDKNEGNIRILSPKTKEMIWAGEAGDRSLLLPFYRRGGERKVADRIVRTMMKDLF